MAARLFGYDLFISFALGPLPRGTQGLASDLARRLRERDHTVFFSEDEAPPGSPLDATLRQALHRSRLLVVLVNHETLRSPRWVRVEVEEFRRRHPGRPVIPVNIGGALEHSALAGEAQTWLPFRDHIWLDADEASAAAGIADDALVERLVIAPGRVRANVAWRRLVGGAVGLLALLAAGLAVTAYVAIGQRDEAVALQVIAQGAGTPNGDLDTKLLAAAEALRRYPDRMDARLQALAQLARAADHRALLRPGFDPGGWAASRDGRLLVIAGARGETAVLSLADWRTLDAVTEPVPAARDFPRLILGPDGSTLVTDRDGTWTMRRIVDGRLQPETTLKPPPEMRLAIPRHLSPDNRRLLAAGHFGIWLWTIGDTTAVQLADGAHDCLAFSDDGSRVLIGDGTGTIAIRLADGRLAERSRTHTGPTVASSTDCARVAVTEVQSSGTYRISIYDSLSGAVLSVLSDEAGARRPAATFSRDGRFIALADSRVLGLWSVEKGAPVWTTPSLTPVMGTPFFGPRQDWVAVEVGDPPMQERRLQVHDARTGAFQLDVPVGHPVDDAVFGPHGDGVLTLGPGSGERKGRALDVWRLGHWDRLRDDRGVVLAASVELGGPGGSLVIGLKNAGGQEFRDPASGALRDAARYPDDHGTLSREAAARLGYKGSIAPYALAPDGNTLVASDRDGGVVLLDRRRDGPGRLLHRHPGRVTRLVFDPRGQWLASAAYDVEGDVIAQPADGSEPPVIVVRGAGRPERFHFVDSARWLMVGDTVWDIVRRVPVASFSGQGTRLAGLDLAPTGDAAAWLFDDGSVRLGRWSAPALVREVCGLVARNLGCEEWRRHYGDEPYRATCTAMPAPVCDTPR